MVELRTARLILRPWREADLRWYARMNADPDVRRYFPTVLTEAQSNAQAAALQAHIAAHGFGFWCVERAADGAFVGMAGLQHVGFAAAFTPAVEIGWRLEREQWGQGYASEAARAALDYGFGVAGLAEIVAFTTMDNLRSRAVMQRIGMRHDPARDFDHPDVPPGHALRPHMLYSARRVG